MEVHCLPVDKNKARKRATQPEKWKANIAKANRYKPKAMPEITCDHDNRRYKCKTLKMTDIKKFHDVFYKNSNKTYQDALLLKYCHAVPTKRRRPKNNKHSRKGFTTKFTVPAHSTKKVIPVCQKTFLTILGLTRYRIQYIMKKHFETGEFPTEKRGGNHKEHLYSEIKKDVRSFITSLKCTEPHYCRSSSSVRKYLPSELNIKKLHKMYMVKNARKPCAKINLFRKIFNNEFNLGFGSPRTDICSTCLQFDEKIKRETNLQEKNKLMTCKRVHILRAKAFYSLLKEKPANTKIISFDCQKNQPLPKIADQSVYYSRQLYFHNQTVVEGSSKDPLKPENVYAYTWTEEEYSKDSNTIASIIYHRLNNTDFTNISTIRLIADGCGGQNKNSILMSMCCKWLLENNTVNHVELVFPVTGHSYLPSDRVFGQIEKEVKRKEVIIHPKEYKEIISKYATILNLGESCPVYDWKAAAGNIIKPPGQWHFKFKESKRFFIKKTKNKENVGIQGETFYKAKFGRYANICRKDKNFNMMVPQTINSGITVNHNKINDVKNLLVKHYGVEWRSLSDLEYYKKVIDCDSSSHKVDSSQEESTLCDEEDHYCCEPQIESSDLII